MYDFSVITAVLLLFSFVKSEEANCDTKETCSDCIQTLGCVWCSELISEGNTAIISHCLKEDAPFSNLCPKDKLTAPQRHFKFVQDSPLQSHKDGEATQIRPQKIKVVLRKGEEFALPFQYRQAENYPIDLYYIMDLSASMEDHREKLAKLGGKLVDVMRNITTDFRLGFGSFVDKTDMPFVSTVPEKLKSPCKLNKPGRTVICVPPYSYKNHMSLTDNFAAFSEEVGKAQVSGNLDSPEGGFDAIMQAIVCEKEIGWRKKARHLLVFSTDADFHIAGDGKLAGVIEPNDAQCHLQNNEYTHALVYDYPSISQINYVAKENNINIIFAIVKAKGKEMVYNIYEKLQQRIENSATGALTVDSSNVVNLVLDNYNKIAESITMTHNSGSEVEVRYTSNCPNPKENGCSNVHVGEVVNFTAFIRPVKCPSNTQPQIVTIKPDGIDESLTVELEVVCKCECEEPGHPDYYPNSENCSTNGDLQCGVCSCKSGRFGKSCECDSLTSNTDDVSACRRSANEEICSGLGTCKCRKCECAKRPEPQLIYGKFCECDNYSCERNDGQVCSGAGRGTCDCGLCKCSAGWIGKACECPDSNATCVAPDGNSEICSGRGRCICGECNCDEVDGHPYFGRFCEECPSCPGQRCEEIRHCVECLAYQNGMLTKEECKANCTTFDVELIDRVQENPSNENIKICRAPDLSGCTIVFQYTYDDKKELVVKAQKTKMCAEDVNVLAVVLTVIGSIVLAGVVMLIVWKVFTTVHDRREYEKFENERLQSRWHRNENPIYRKATSEFRNPLYNR